jgi:mannose-6-phosphate isomerase-like protein (cupin superfamily)
MKALLLILASAPDLPVPVQRESAEHYVWGEVNDGWHLVKRDDLSVIRETIQPGSAEVRHYHVRARQFFHVLSGELTMEVGGRTHKPIAGQGIEIPPGTPHQAQNRSGTATEMLVTSAPKSHGDRVEAAR